MKNYKTVVKGGYAPRPRMKKCYWDKSMRMGDYWDIRDVALLPDTEVEKIKSFGDKDYAIYLEICAEFEVIEMARRIYDTLGM